MRACVGCLTFPGAARCPAQHARPPPSARVPRPTQDRHNNGAPDFTNERGELTLSLRWLRGWVLSGPHAHCGGLERPPGCGVKKDCA